MEVVKEFYLDDLGFRLVYQNDDEPYEYQMVIVNDENEKVEFIYPEDIDEFIEMFTLMKKKTKALEKQRALNMLEEE